MEIKVLATITVVMAAYMIVGGIIFQKIETITENEFTTTEIHVHLPIHGNFSTPVLTIDEVKLLLMKAVERTQQTPSPWELEVRVIDLETAQTSGGRTDVDDFFKNHHHENDTEIEKSEHDVVIQTVLRNKQRSRSHWSLYDAIFYAQTIVTTVGYGSIAPVTPTGRAVTCIYAVLGIPVIGVWMAGIGELIFYQVESFRKKAHVKKRLRTWFLFAHFCIVILVGSIIFIFLPSILFSVLEDWSYADSIYYAIMSLTTIGFGDLVAGAKEESPQWYRVLLTFWLLLGLGWLSMIISLIMHMMRYNATKVINKASEIVVLQIKQRMHMSGLQRTMSFSGIQELSVFLPELENPRISSLRPPNALRSISLISTNNISSSVNKEQSSNVKFKKISANQTLNLPFTTATVINEAKMADKGCYNETADDNSCHTVKTGDAISVLDLSPIKKTEEFLLSIATPSRQQMVKPPSATKRLDRSGLGIARADVVHRSLSIAYATHHNGFLTPLDITVCNGNNRSDSLTAQRRPYAYSLHTTLA